MFFNVLGPLLVKTRFLLSGAAMFAPLLFLGAGGFFALNWATAQMEDVIEEALEEEHPVMHLEKEVQRANMEGHDLLMLRTPMAREEFRAANSEVERNFAELLDAPFAMDEEHRYLRKSYTVWQAHAKSLLNFPLGDKLSREGLEAMERFDAGMEQVLFHLEQVRAVAQEEIDQRAALAYGVRARMLILIVVVFAVGIVIWLVGALALTRSVLLPVYDIREGIRRMSAGDYSHRVFVSTNDELGELARSFNVMGERISAELKEQNASSMRDELTGLYNRNEFLELFRSEIKRSQRYQRPFSLILFDVDDFGNLNASFGRETGDHALKTIAVRIGDLLREVDRIARYGPDEIAVILTEIEAGGAFVLAERVREAVSSLSFQVPGGQEVRLTVSAGITDFARERSTEDALLFSAEKALKKARSEGGDRVVSA